ncbi:hypothetical protein BDV25DRAFT_144633 [Aspergillus avenaceus]|uniref:BZIP domain-containing protein n=1 Tax=Aspergillus avenaceus TaxID=36643 RepID=A0A5N6TGT1_ASPAV|nr:hypothetical protein BDV25DRAFT_144633 [Aspergillus avenaceus]
MEELEAVEMLSRVRGSVTHWLQNFKYSIQNGLVLNPSNGKISSFSPETDIIDPQRTTSSFIPSTSQPSESPVPGPLNFSIPSGSSSSLSNTITTFGVTSFITDNHQQKWLLTPPPPQPTAQNLNPNNNNNNNNNSPSSLPGDFVLFPPQSSPRDSCALAPLSTTPRRPLRHPSLVHPVLRSRHSPGLQQFQPQLSASPVQVPHSTRLVQSTGSTQSSSHRISPAQNRSLRFQAAAIALNPTYPYRPPVTPSNSLAKYSQYQNHLVSPPNYRRIMSTPNIAQDLPDFFDFHVDHFGDDIIPSTEPTMLSHQQVTASVLAPQDTLADLPSGTVSPKDLLMDASAPPSTSFTDISTPSFESPGYFSQDTSPMFATNMELGHGHEEWDPLFPQDVLSIPLDTAHFDVAAALSQKKVDAPQSPVIRTNASRASSPTSTRSVTKHSAVAGVNARQKRPLLPIEFDSADPVAAKRARNTEAARKSRARKLERQEEMQRKIDELEKRLEEAQRREQYWKAMAQNKG